MAVKKAKKKATRTKKPSVAIANKKCKGKKGASFKSCVRREAKKK